MERLWLGVADICPPFTVQLVVEGAPETGEDGVSQAVLEEAVGLAAAVHPGVRLVLRGHLSWSRWEARLAPPPVRVVDGRRWSGRDERGAPFLLTPLPPSGPTVEVLLVEGTPRRLVFRGHHSVVDGRGLLTFAEDVFRALRGEPCLGADLGLVDRDLARELQTPGRGPSRPSHVPPTGAGRAVARGTPMPWRRVRYEGSPRRLLPRLALAVHAASRRYTDGPLRIEVPVDLRRHLPEGVRTTANFTGSAQVDLVDVLDAPDPIEAFTERIRAEAASPSAADPVIDTWVFRYLPRATSRRILSRVRRQGLSGKVPTSAVLSNLGRYPLARLSAPAHVASTWFWVPSGGPVVPLFILITGDGVGVDLSVGMSPELASEGRLDGLLEGIVEHLSRGADAPERRKNP